MGVIMVFSSLLFLFYFLPLLLLIYFLVKSKYRNLVLLIGSIIFYSWGEPVYIWIMVFSTILDFSSGKGIHRAQTKNNQMMAKFWLGVSLVGNLSLLLFFKYANFAISNINQITDLSLNLLNISLPIGISFYTFQTMSYSIDVYRKDAEVQNNLLNFATYVTLFPQLIAGPIVRYQTVAQEINKRVITVDMIAEGIQRFIIGLAKKVLLANNIGLVWHTISQGNVEQSVASAWLGILAFALQIYFDFSGYSDMAIGLGKILGFNFLDNFNYPYMSRSITEFWRRWHISLGTWFKEYVYIPLGGNRGGVSKHMRNIIVVWLLTGLWHGASWNFVYWGLFFALLLIIEKRYLLDKLNNMPSWVSHFYTLFMLLISWAFFAFDNMTQSANYMSMMFGFSNLKLINSDFLYLLLNNVLLLVILVLAATNIPKRLAVRFTPQNKYLQSLYLNSYLLCLFGLSVAYLVNSSFNPFLYFKF